jgi:putative endonuclease
MTERPNKALVGKQGEDTACKYLEKHGYKVLERNYWKKFGEIDIVSERTVEGVKWLHFVEVKAVTRQLGGLASKLEDGKYFAEDNVHPWKLKRLRRAIEIYLSERKVSEDQDWQVDVITVELDYQTRHAQVRMLEDIEI